MIKYLALVVCYFLGAIPYGVIVGKLTCGIDIRQYGSGNIGATNVLRTLGLGPALLVMFFDTVKGLVAVVLCQQLHMNEYGVVAGGILSILGHSFSVFLNFKGGKGVATSLGMIIGLNPIIAAIAFGGWLALVGITRVISIASILAAASVPAQMFFWKSQHVPVPYQAIAMAAALLIVLKHKSNIKRLMNGSEPKVGQKCKVQPMESDGEGRE